MAFKAFRESGILMDRRSKERFITDTWTKMNTPNPINRKWWNSSEMIRKKSNSFKKKKVTHKHPTCAWVSSTCLIEIIIKFCWQINHYNYQSIPLWWYYFGSATKSNINILKLEADVGTSRLYVYILQVFIRIFPGRFQEIIPLGYRRWYSWINLW